MQNAAIVGCLTLFAAQAEAQVGNPRGIETNGSVSPPTINTPLPSSIPPARQTPPANGTTAPVNTANGTGSQSVGNTLDEVDAEGATPSFVRPENQQNVLGRYRTAAGEVRVSRLLLDAYKDSVVRVVARDEAGNKLSEAMGVAVGLTNENLPVGDSNFIATSLSVILGNSIQWADKIEIVHDTGTSYLSDVALIDEQLNLVLLRPKNKPTPIRFVAADQERGQVDVLTISFDRDRRNDLIPNAHRAVLAAINPEEGTLAISGKTITNAQVGTGIINMNGELMGMVLPDGNGVLSSAIAKAIQKIQGRKAFHPRLVGAIMGRGVLVDPSVPEAHQTIQDALADIKSKKAPKADTTRYLPAYTNALKPKAADRIILKIAPGTFSMDRTLDLPGNLSFAGSGPRATVLVQRNPAQPLLSLDKVKNVTIANLRLVPAAEQKSTIPTVAVRDSDSVTFLGNVIEAKGGRAAIHLLGTQRVSVTGNAFPNGKEKAIYCQTSGMAAEANSFLGKWPQAVAIGKGCVAQLTTNLFIDNEIAVAVSAEGRRLDLLHNTFLNVVIGARFYGRIADLFVEDNLFYANRYSLVTNENFREGQISRNSAWKSIPFREGQAITGLDFVKGKPEFRNADYYDFRLMPGSPGANSGVPRPDGSPTDIGAYQAETFLGDHTSQFLVTLETAIGEKGLAEAWGFKLLTNGQSAPVQNSPATSIRARQPTSTIAPAGGAAPAKRGTGGELNGLLE